MKDEILLQLSMETPKVRVVFATVAFGLWNGSGYSFNQAHYTHWTPENNT